MKGVMRDLLVGPAITLILAVPANARLHDNSAMAEFELPGSASDVQRLAQTNPPGTPDAPAPDTVQPSLTVAQLDRMLERGEALLMSGNITSARLLFMRVVAAGDPRGAIWVGMTYDPDMYARLPVAGIKPDREQAEFWYKKAGQRPIYPTGDNIVAAPAAPDNSQKPGSAEWIAACARKYKSFEPATGRFTTYSGKKLRCRLP